MNLFQLLVPVPSDCRSWNSLWCNETLEIISFSVGLCSRDFNGTFNPKEEMWTKSEYLLNYPYRITLNRCRHRDGGHKPWSIQVGNYFFQTVKEISIGLTLPGMHLETVSSLVYHDGYTFVGGTTSDMILLHPSKAHLDFSNLRNPGSHRNIRLFLKCGVHEDSLLGSSL